MNKKPPKKTILKRRATSSTESVAKLKQKIAAQARALELAAEERRATSEILRMIAKSPADLQLVLDAIAESATCLCDAADAVVWRVDGEVLSQAAHFGPIAIQLARGEGHSITRDSPNSRAVVDRETIHVHDLRAAIAEFPLSKNRGIASGLRTVLVTPRPDFRGDPCAWITALQKRQCPPGC